MFTKTQDIQVNDAQGPNDRRVNVLVTCGGSEIMADVVALVQQIPSISSILLVDATEIDFDHGCKTIRVPRGQNPEYPAAIHALVEKYKIGFIYVGSDEEALALSQCEWARALSHLDTFDHTALVIDKYRLHVELLANSTAGTLVPDFRQCSSGIEVRQMIAEFGSVIERPIRGRGSKGLRHLVSERLQSQYPQAIAMNAADVSDDTFYSAYLPGDKFSADCIFEGGMLLTCMVRNNGPEVKYRPPTAQAWACDDPDVFVFATEVGKALSLSGFHQIECGKNTEGSLQLIEINPRLDATLPITRCYDHNFYELLLERKAVGLMKPRKRFFKRFSIAYTK